MHGLGLCETVNVELDSPSQLPKMLWVEDGRRSVNATFRDGSIAAYGNVICNRAALYKLLGAASDSEAYSRLVNAVSTASSSSRHLPVQHDFENFYTRATDVKNVIRRLPATRFYECDGGPYLTGGIVIACTGGVCNASIHRMMRVGDLFAVRVVPRHLYRMLRERGRLPVAVVLGAHPLVELAAATSPPYGVFELNVAFELGWKGGVCLTPFYSIPVPCDAGIILEGILGGGYAREGPFTDILLLCDEVREEPLFEPQAVYVSSEQPRVWQILPGGTEHRILMGFPREALVWDSVRRSVGREPIVRLLGSGGGWLSLLLAFNDIDHAHAKLAALAAIAAHPSVKIVVVTLSDINVDDERDVNWAIATRTDPHRDVLILSDIRGSTLDPTSSGGIGSKMIILALPRGDTRRFTRPRLVGD